MSHWEAHHQVDLIATGLHCWLTLLCALLIGTLLIDCCWVVLLINCYWDDSCWWSWLINCYWAALIILCCWMYWWSFAAGVHWWLIGAVVRCWMNVTGVHCLMLCWSSKWNGIQHVPCFLQFINWTGAAHSLRDTLRLQILSSDVKRKSWISVAHKVSNHFTANKRFSRNDFNRRKKTRPVVKWLLQGFRFTLLKVKNNGCTLCYWEGRNDHSA